MEGGAPDLGEEAMRAKLEAANAPPLLPTGFRLMWLSLELDDLDDVF